MALRSARSTLVPRLVRALAVLAVAVPVAASAQVMTPPIPVPGEEPADSWLNASFSHVFKADVDDLLNVQMQRESALVSLGRRFGEPDSKFKVAAQFSYQLSAYNFFNDTLGSLGQAGVLNSNPPRTDLQCGPAGPGCGGSLWSDIHQFTFLGLGMYEVDADWTVLGGGLFRLSGESGADFSEAITAGAFGGFLYHPRDDLSVGVLLGAMSQIEDRAAIVPLPLFNWKFADEWRFDLGIQQLGGVGYGPKLVWVPSTEWDLSLVWSYERRRYRLDNGTGSTKNFIGDETSAPLVLQVNWHLDPLVHVGAFAGVVTAGSVRMETQGGNRVFDKSYQITPTVGLNAIYRF